jgi:hypothetical protein
VAAQSKRPLSTSTPPTTVPWPQRNLVAEWKTRSAPCSKGCISQGVVKVRVHQQRHAGVVRDGGHRGDVQHVQARVAQRLAEQQPGLGPHAARQASMSPGFTKVVLDAEARSV